MTPTLDQIQRWMQAAITHPGGVAEGIASAEARAALEVGPGDAEAVVTRSRALTALERLGIYGNAYYARLRECLREEYPVLLHALGREIFDGFAVGYLQRYPSRSYTLIDLGRHFARYLEETRPEGEGTSWPDFLIDLAMLEWTFSAVFDGPGVEGMPPLDPAELAALPPDRLAEARLECAPCLRLLAFHYPVHTYFAAVRREEDPEIPQPAETFLAVSRAAFTVRHYELSRPAYALLEGIAQGATVGEAIGRAAAAAGPDLARLAGNLRQWFHLWAAEGFFRAIILRSP